MRLLQTLACVLALGAAGSASAQGAAGGDRIVFPASVSQGALVFGKVSGIDGFATVAVTRKMIINTSIMSINGMRFISVMP